MKRVKLGEISWKILSTYRGQIMGAAILWIILLHGLDFYPQIRSALPILGFVLDRGMMGVEIFLLVSGIGLYFSFSKNGDTKSFYLKRVNRVVIPYLIISLPFWIWKDIFLERSIGAFFTDISLFSFWKYGAYTVWYLALIIVLYAIYPILFSAFLKENAVLRKSLFAIVGVALPFFVYVIFRNARKVFS